MGSRDLPVFPEIIYLPLNRLLEAPWNPNRMDPLLLSKLKRSVTRFGLVGMLVVRPFEDGYQVLSGNQRLQVLRDLRWDPAPCVVVDIDDAEAKLLTQTLNALHGFDDLGLKADLVADILATIPKQDVLALLPETAERLAGLSNLNPETITQNLLNWQASQEAKLRHFTCQLTRDQLATVERALASMMVQARVMQTNNPNLKGNSLYLLAQNFLNAEENR